MMKSFLGHTFFVFLIFAMPVLSQAQDCGNIDLRWKKCSVTRDCILIQNSCDSLSDPVNRKFQMEATKFNKCNKKYVDCMKVAESNFVAKCIKNICDAILIKK